MIQLKINADVQARARAALAAGCRWLLLEHCGSEEAAAVKAMCDEREAMCSLCDADASAVKETGVHGLHLSRWDAHQLLAVREAIDGETIVGLTCRDIDEALQVPLTAVDYIVLDDMSLEACTAAIAAMRRLDAEVPVVAPSSLVEKHGVGEVVNAGFNGVMAEASLPLATVTQWQEQLELMASQRLEQL